jgi:predicted metal-binding membrane protein
MLYSSGHVGYVSTVHGVQRLHKRFRTHALMLPLGLVSLVGWYMLPQSAHDMTVSSLCLSPGDSWLGRSMRLANFLATDQATPLWISWSWMLLAMSPLLLRSSMLHMLTHQWHGRSIGLFLVIHLATWLLALPLLTFAMLATDKIAVSLDISPSWLAALLALFWHASPWRQSALHQCRLPETSEQKHGRQQLDAWRTSTAAAFGCVGACWPLMLWAMTLGEQQRLGMAIVTAALLIERFWLHKSPRVEQASTCA